MRRALLMLHNPLAGRAGRARVDAVTASLIARSASVVARSLGPGVAANEAIADADQFDAVVVAGGDGTLRSVLTALAARRCAVPVGIVPVGTGNVFAHEIGLPHEPSDLADVLIAGPTVAVTGARANDEPFFLMAGVGFDGRVIRGLDQSLKQRIGKLAYAVPVLRALFAPPPALDILIEGQLHAAEWVIVTRARCYGGGFVLARNASLERPGFVAVVFTPTDRVGRVGRLLALALGRMDRLTGVPQIPCRHVHVSAARPVPVEVDGEPFGTTPLEAHCDGPIANVIVPETYLTSPGTEKGRPMGLPLDEPR